MTGFQLVCRKCDERFVLHKLKLISLLLALSACATTSAEPSVSETISPTETQCWTSPLTGLCADETTPVLIVKIDDVSQARPQWSLNQADVVVVEPVEGGLTRLFAIYQSTAPTTLGPIRSARVSDIDLAAAFTKPGLAYSGASSKTSPFLWKSTLQLVGAPQGSTGYFRDSDRPAPHNLMGNYEEILQRIEKPENASIANMSGWSFSDKPTLGKEILWFRAQWPGSKKTFIWNSDLEKWSMKVYEEDLVTQVGENEFEDVVADTIFVMNTELMPLPYKTHATSPTPYPRTYGEGSGFVLSQGTVIEAIWKRPTLSDLPRWYTTSGKEIAVAKGRSWWLVLADNDTQVIRYPKIKNSPSPSESASS